MFICRVNSEEEYLDLIYDAFTHGVRCPNQFVPLSERDENNHDVLDKFKELPETVMYDYLGVIDNWDGESDPEPFSREKMELEDSSLRPSDYPVIVFWDWYDDWDRVGSIKVRLFEWISISKIPSTQDGMTPFKRERLLWEENHREIQ